MKTWYKKLGRFIVDAIEIYVPFTAFTALFLIFLIGILFRYFFKPLTWTLELSLIFFIWTSLLGGLFAKRDDSHVVFTLIYDRVSPLARLWMRLCGNSLLAVSFCIGLIPTWKYVVFMGYKKSNVLSIKMDIVYFPFIIFLGFMIGHYFMDIYRDLQRLIKGDLE